MAVCGGDTELRAFEGNASDLTAYVVHGHRDAVVIDLSIATAEAVEAYLEAHHLRLPSRLYTDPFGERAATRWNSDPEAAYLMEVARRAWTR